MSILFCRNLFMKSVSKLHRIPKFQYTTQTTSKINGKSNPKIRLLKILLSEKRNISVATGCLLISSGITMSVPFSLGKILDVVFQKKDNDTLETKRKLEKICGILGIVFLVGGLANFCRIYLFNTASLRIVNKLRKDLHRKILSHEMAFFETRGTGELVHRLANDTYLVGNALSQNLSEGLRSLIMFSIGSGMMVYTSPTLTLVSAMVCPLLAGFAIVNGRFIKKMTKQMMDKNADISKNVEEIFGNVKTVKQFSKENFECDRYTNSLVDYMKLSYREIKARSAFFGMAGFTGNFIVISVMYYGGSLVITESLSIGALTSFIMYTAYTAISINGMSSFYTELNKGLGSSERIWEIMDRKPTLDLESGFIPTAKPNGNFIFENVTFSYPSRPDNVILNNLNLVLEGKKSYAIVGKSGSGKSTLANLILRFYDTNSGVITLDGNDIRSLKGDWLRNSIGAVPQEPVLFQGSIRDNILYGLPENVQVDETFLEYVLEQANVYEFVRHFPDKLNTLVGQRGVMISGGQKQRIAIARALINNPPILIFDEATSALDTVTEERVQNAIEKIKEGRTVLTIAHRLSTIKNADKILVLDQGTLIEEGSYDSLINRESGYFKELVKNQAFM